MYPKIEKKKAQEQVTICKPDYEPGGKLTVAWCSGILGQGGKAAEQGKVIVLRDFLYRIAEVECEQRQRLNKVV